MAKLQSVVFQTDYGPYPAGQMAGFLPEEAERLCSTEVKVRGGEKCTIARLPRREDREAMRIAAERTRHPETKKLVRVLVTSNELGPYNIGDDPGLPAAQAEAEIRAGRAIPWADAQEPEEKGVEMPRRAPKPRRSPKNTKLKGAPVAK